MQATSRAIHTVEIADVSFTLQAGQAVLPIDRAVVCRDTADAVGALTNLSPERVSFRHQEKTRRPIVFLFPRQGSQ